MGPTPIARSKIRARLAQKAARSLLDHLTVQLLYPIMPRMITPESRSQITTEAAKAFRTGRDFEDYANQFGYKDREHELKGKKILDIGSGKSSFAFEAEAYGATVISLDPSYKYTSPFSRNNAVAALAQELPFRDGSFDEVIASWSLFWVNTGIENALQEMLRVTRAEGQMKVFPALAKDISHPAIEIYTHQESQNQTLVVTKTSDVTAEDISSAHINYCPRFYEPNGFITHNI